MKFVEIISDGTKKGIVIGVFHLTLILLAYSSPFWLDWRWITLGVGLLFLEQIIFGNCILNASQYGNNEGYFYQNLLTHFHIKFNNDRLKLYLRWYIPLIVLGVGFLVQKLFLAPLVHFLW